MVVNNCMDYQTILNYNGVVLENLNGSVSVFIPNNTGNLAPVILTKTCCENIKTNYFFDIDTQQCKWSNMSNSCSLDNSFKLVLNPKGNDGSLFYVEDNDNCSLNIDFDYLFKIKCETLVNVLDNNSSVIDNTTNNLQLRISDETTNKDDISNKINELIVAINNTPYSIVCESFTSEPIHTEVNSTKITNFGRTGFGLAPFSFDMGNDIKTRVNYGLTEPNGLLKWEEIIGQDNFIKFKNGDPNSYSCTDVQTLYTSNILILNNNLLSTQETPSLMFETEVPFGTRTRLIDELNALTLLHNDSQNLLSLLNDQSNITKADFQTLSATSSNSCQSPVGVFEKLDVSVIIDVVTSANTLEKVFEYNLFPAIGNGNLYDYLVMNPDSGFYVCGDPTLSETSFSNCTPLTLNISALTSPNVFSCNSIMDDINQELLMQSGLNSLTGLSSNVFESNWLHYHAEINDPNILSLITNKKIKLSFKVNNTCAPFCLLIDDIQLDKVCTHVETNNIFLTQSPGFKLEKIVDNKKSWLDNTDPENRSFVITNNLGDNGIRQTNYDVNDERLVINTKEIDLDINIASAIETDVLCYIRDNDCILSGISSSCIITGDTTFSCPVDYSADTGNTICTKLTYEAAVFSGTPFTAFTGSINSQYSFLGTNFYENITDLAKPIVTSAATNNVYNATGGTLSIQSTIVSNFWGTNPSCVACTPAEVGKKGRLNNVGIWGSPLSSTPLGQWIGFATCFNLPESKTYYIGVGADNGIRIKLNGEVIVIFNNTNQFNFRTWHVFPLTMEAGLNIIELEGINLSSIASFGAEIYDTDLATLTGATTSGETNIVFSTSNEIGNEFILGEFSGYSCSTGFAFDNCSGGTPACVSIERVPISADSTTVSGCCGDKNVDLNLLLTSELSGITTIEEFERVLTSELIDVKSRKTLSSYPTLRLLYDRYLNSSLYCGTNSSGFNYENMNQFANLVGNYWIDIVEQVVPATTIWDSVKVYSNTVFDRQKFKYKSYSSLFCGNQFSGETVSSPINGTTGTCTDVSVSMIQITPSQGYNITPTVTTCNSICLAQMNFGSEFIGNVTIIGNSQNNDSSLYAN